MLVRVIDIPEEGRAKDAEGEEEAHGEAEHQGGEDGVGDQHRVDVEAAALLLVCTLRLLENSGLEKRDEIFILVIFAR